MIRNRGAYHKDKVLLARRVGLIPRLLAQLHVHVLSNPQDGCRLVPVIAGIEHLVACKDRSALDGDGTVELRDFGIDRALHDARVVGERARDGDVCALYAGLVESKVVSGLWNMPEHLCAHSGHRPATALPSD